MVCDRVYSTKGNSLFQTADFNDGNCPFWIPHTPTLVISERLRREASGADVSYFVGACGSCYQKVRKIKLRPLLLPFSLPLSVAPHCIPCARCAPARSAVIDVPIPPMGSAYVDLQ